MQEGCLANLKVVKHGFSFYFGFVQFGKERFDTVNDALLLVERGEGKLYLCSFRTRKLKKSCSTCVRFKKWFISF